jgi:predicted nucleotidyltransferase
VRLPPDLPHDVDELLRRLTARLQALLGGDLLGLYLFGSLVSRGFVHGVSDVDLVAILDGPPTMSQLDALAEAHVRIVEQTPEWHERVEVVYVPRAALAGFRRESHPAARISPGEPFHAIEVDRTWVLDWYPLREDGFAIVGPPPDAYVPEIAPEEYIDAAREHILAWPLTLDAMPTRGSQAYAILTACRALRTVELGEPSSKREAAAWVIDVAPELGAPIREALLWHDRSRLQGDVDGAATFEETVAVLREIQVRLSSA